MLARMGQRHSTRLSTSGRVVGSLRGISDPGHPARGAGERCSCGPASRRASVRGGEPPHPQRPPRWVLVRLRRVVKSNASSGNWYTPASYVACGFLIYQADGVSASSNNFFNNERNQCNFGKDGGTFKRPHRSRTTPAQRGRPSGRPFGLARDAKGRLPLETSHPSRIGASALELRVTRVHAS